MRILKWVGLFLVGAVSLIVVGCSTVGLPRVSTKPDGTLPTPDLLAPIGGMEQVTTPEEWNEVRAPFWTDILLSQVYGSIPAGTPPRIVSSGLVKADILDGKANFHFVQLELTIGDHTFRQDVHFVVPKGPGPHPVILGAGSCPDHITFPDFPVDLAPDLAYPGYCDGDGWESDLAHFIFGRYIETPPLEELIDHGFAFGGYYPGMIVPDSTGPGMAALQLIRNEADMPHGPYAGIGVWAWVASRIEDYLETEPLFDSERAILFGHSRMAKSSLLAGALDSRFAGVISHQSGTGGAAIQKNLVGESIEEITKSYPHWFTPSYALWADREDAMPFDQHALVALMAPRPLLLGNAARDRWADPQGTFAAAKAAGNVYELLGAEPFTASNLKDFEPDATLAYQFREGTHGIVPEDWTPFIEWLDSHFGQTR